MGLRAHHSDVLMSLLQGWVKIEQISSSHLFKSGLMQPLKDVFFVHKYFQLLPEKMYTILQGVLLNL